MHFNPRAIMIYNNNRFTTASSCGENKKLITDKQFTDTGGMHDQFYLQCCKNNDLA